MPKKNIESIPTDEHLFDVELDEYVKEAMSIYGHYVLEDRAIPDFRDGLKPVQRRILWSMSELGIHGHRGVLNKSVRVVGDTTGKYHPHGDQSVYGALVSMVHLPKPTVFGSGNFGNLVKPPAAYRYTECRLTRYSDIVFFDPLYKADSVTQKVENFDGSQQEPIVLSSVLPNLLLNGAFGIGTGSRCSIPAFEAKGVIALSKLALRRKRITPELAMKHLVPKSHAGGEAYYAEDDEEAYNDLLQFYETGAGAVYWVPKVRMDLEKRSMDVFGFAPTVTGGLESIERKIANDDRVAEMVNSNYLDENKQSVFQYTIKLKQNVAKAKVEDTLWEIAGYFDARQSLLFTITERLPPADDEFEVQTRFFQTNITDFFKRWAIWRTKLEKRAILNQRDLLRDQLKQDELLLLAVVNKEVIFKATDFTSVDTALDYIVENIDGEVTKDEASKMLDLPNRRLMKLQEKPIRDRIQMHKKRLAGLKRDYKDPTDRILLEMDAAVGTMDGDLN